MDIIDVTIRESVYLKHGMTEEKALLYLKEYVKLMPFREVRDVEICFLDNMKQDTLLYDEDYIRGCHDIVVPIQPPDGSHIGGRGFGRIQEFIGTHIKRGCS